MAGLFFEILFNRDKAKKSIKDTKQELIGMLDDVDKKAKKTGTSLSDLLTAKSYTKEQAVAAKQFVDNMSKFKRASVPTLATPGMVYGKDKDFTDFTQKMFGKRTQTTYSGAGGKKILSAGYSASELIDARIAYKKFLTEAIQGTEKLGHVTEKTGNIFKRFFGGKGGGGGGSFGGGGWGGLGGGWLSRMKYQVLSIIAGGASIYGLSRLGRGIFNSATDTEKSLFAMSVPFGNKGNASAAMNMVNQMSTNGSPFGRKDMLTAFQSMMEGGVDPRKKKNYNLYGNIAGTSGKSMTEVANDLNSAFYGDSNVLRKYGFSNKQVFRLDKMVNQRPDARKNVIMGILQGDKRYENGMRDFAYTWEGMTNKLRSSWDAFKQSIMGSPTDKDSLYSAVKNLFGKIVSFLQRNQHRIQRVGMVIGQVFKWIVQKLQNLGARMGHAIERILKKTDGTNEQFKEKVARLVLWLEAAKEKVVRFFHKWGWAIKSFVAVWLGLKLVKLISAPFVALFGVGKKVLSFFGLLKTSASSIGGVFSGLLGRLTLIGGAIAGTYAMMKKNQKDFNDLVIDPSNKKTVVGTALSGVNDMLYNVAKLKYVTARKGGMNPIAANAFADKMIGANLTPIEMAVMQKMQGLGGTADMLFSQVKSGLESPSGKLPTGGHLSTLKKFFGTDDAGAQMIRDEIMKVSGDSPGQTTQKRLKAFDDLLNARLAALYGENKAIIVQNMTVIANNPEEFYKKLQEHNSVSGNVP